MVKLFIFLLIQLLLITPLLVISLNKFDQKPIRVFLFLIYFALYTSLLALPGLFPATKIIHSDQWNWSGKIFAITGSILFYARFKALFTNLNFITFKQKYNLFYIVALVYFLVVGLAILSAHHSNDRAVYFLFQLTMPGIDEELAFRGIILGLLSNSLTSKIGIGSFKPINPALLITSILFGLGHAFQIDSHWIFHYNYFEFVNSFTIGLLLGWMTLKSGSVFMPVLAHGLINTLPQIIFWI